MSAALSRAVPASRRQSDDEVNLSDPALRLDALAAQVEAGFRDAATVAVREAHGAGVPVAVLDETGRPAWLTPDGLVQPV